MLSLSEYSFCWYFILEHTATKLSTVHRLELSRSFGNEPTLLGLLNVYKEYYPDVILGQSVIGKISRFEVSLPQCTVNCLF